MHSKPSAVGSLVLSVHFLQFVLFLWAKVYSWAERFLDTHINQTKTFPNTPNPIKTHPLPINPPKSFLSVILRNLGLDGMCGQGAICLTVQAEASQSSERLAIENKQKMHLDITKPVLTRYKEDAKGR